MIGDELVKRLATPSARAAGMVIAEMVLRGSTTRHYGSGAATERPGFAVMLDRGLSGMPVSRACFVPTSNTI
jgi:hypothetical protein